jgi:hypothetical protein
MEEDYLNIQRVFDKFTTREYQHTYNCHIFNMPVPEVSPIIEREGWDRMAIVLQTPLHRYAICDDARKVAYSLCWPLMFMMTSFSPFPSPCL